MTALVVLCCLVSCPAVLQGVQTAVADTLPPVNVIATGEKGCGAVGAIQARRSAKAALQRSRYRQAAQCYLAAGDKAKADFSFVRAAGAESVVTKRQLATNARQVKQQFRQLREAFASH